MKRMFMTMLVGICVFLFPPLANAQTVYSLTGTVQSEADGPLPGANVVLKASGNGARPIGATTDADGRFSLFVGKGLYTLEISFVGYVTYTASVEVDGDIRLPALTLREDNQLMDEVVVTAHTITYNTDGYVSEVYKNPLYKQMDMTSVLKLSPGTFATSSSVQVYGRGVSKVYLNGRELKLRGEELVNYLEILEAKNVKRMEVISSSGVEEDATTLGGSIIRLVTINPETGGMANVNTYTLHGEAKHMYSAGGSLNWRINQRWGTYLNASIFKGNTENGNRIGTLFHRTGEQLTDETLGENKNLNLRAVWGLTYDLDKNNLFSMEGTLWKNTQENPMRSLTRSLTGGEEEEVASGNSLNERDFTDYNLSFSYIHKFSDAGNLTFKADHLGVDSDDDGLQRYRYVGGDHTEYNHQNDVKNRLTTLSADYTHRFKALDGRLSVGAKATWLDNENKTDYAFYQNGELDRLTSYSDPYRYEEEVYALYAKYAFTYRRLGLSLGVRMEDARISPQSVTNPERNHVSRYTDFFPEVRLNYNIHPKKGHNLNLSYNRGLSRPMMESLNPTVRRTGEYSYSMGNPWLEPAYSDRLELTATLFHKYSLNVRYTRFENHSFSLSEERDGILYSTSQNGMTTSALSFYLSIPVKLADWWNVRLNASYYHNRQEHLDLESSHGSWGGGYHMDIRLPKDFSISHSLIYSQASRGLYDKQTERPMVNSDISKDFPKQGWRISLGVMDIFNQAGSRKVDYFNDQYYQQTRGIRSNFAVRLSVNYNFRWGQKSMVRRNMAGNMDEMSRISME